MGNKDVAVATGKNSLAELRATLFETMQAVKDGKMDLDRARTVNAIGKTLVESAMVEVEFIKATGGEGSDFMGGREGEGADSTESHLRLASRGTPAAHNPFPMSARHRLEG